MTPGEIQHALRAAGLDAYVSSPGRGKINIMLGTTNAESLARHLAAPPKARELVMPPKTVRPHVEVPDELAHAIEADPESEFVRSCAEQFEEKGWLSPAQLSALGSRKAARR